MKPAANPVDLHSILGLRWLRCVVWHLLCSCLFLTLWACLTWSRAGLFDFLSSSLSPLPPLFILLFFFSQLAFVLSLRLVCEPACTPSVSAGELASWVSLRVWLGALGGKLDKEAQADADITATRVRETGKRLLLLLSFSLNGAIAILASSGLQPYIVQSYARSCGFGALFGLVYGIRWLHRREWVVSFPIIQRRFLLRFKLGIFASVAQAFQLAILVPFCCLPGAVYWTSATSASLATWQHGFHPYLHHFLVSFLVLLCWNTATYVVQVIQSERYIFPSPDSDPSLPSSLSTTLALNPTSSHLSLLRHLAFLDLCLLAEDQGTSQRRLPLFEETGTSYSSVINAVSGPVDGLTIRLTKALSQSQAWDTTSLQMMDPNVPMRRTSDVSLFQDYQGGRCVLYWVLSHAFYTQPPLCSNLVANIESSEDERGEAQDRKQEIEELCMWCIRSASALTAASKTEDRFGVAQLTSSNSRVLSALLSCLLALESWMKRAEADDRIRRGRHVRGMGRSTFWNLFSWVSISKFPSNQEAARGLADGLRVGLYRIVASFGGEMVRGGDGGVVEEEWVGREKNTFGSKQQLVDKLKLFLLYEA